MATIILELSFLLYKTVSLHNIQDTIQTTFEKYNIDSLQFALSNEFYSNDLNKYLDIYNRVKEKLQENKQIIMDSIENYKKDRAKRSLEIAKRERSKTIDSIKMKRSMMPLKTNN